MIYKRRPVGGSSNGRISGSDPEDVGSNPSPPAMIEAMNRVREADRIAILARFDALKLIQADIRALEGKLAAPAPKSRQEGV